MAGLAVPRPRAQRWATLRQGRRPLLPTLTAGALLWAALSLFAVGSVLIFYVFEISVVATSAYELQRLQQERDSWLARNEQLQLEVAKARSLRWVEYDATTRLGMVAGERPLHLTVERQPLEAKTDADPESPPEQAPAPEAQPPWLSFSLLEGAASLLGWLPVRS